MNILSMLDLLTTLFPWLVALFTGGYALYSNSQKKAEKQRADTAEKQAQGEKKAREIAEKMRDEIYTANEKATEATREAVKKARDSRDHFSR